MGPTHGVELLSRAYGLGGTLCAAMEYARGSITWREELAWSLVSLMLLVAFNALLVEDYPL